MLAPDSARKVFLYHTYFIPVDVAVSAVCRAFTGVWIETDMVTPNNPHPAYGQELKSTADALLEVPISERERLMRAWDEATSSPGHFAQPYTLGRVTQRLLSAISAVLGYKVVAKKQIARRGYIRHINIRHGVNGVAVAGQIPITREMFALIPHILEHFDSVAKGHPTRGGIGVLIRKQYSDGTAVVVDMVQAGKNLEIRSYRIDK